MTEMMTPEQRSALAATADAYEAAAKTIRQALRRQDELDGVREDIRKLVEPFRDAPPPRRHLRKPDEDTAFTAQEGN